MMKRNAWNWRGLLLGLTGAVLGFGTATAQNPTSVDVDLVQNNATTLEVRVRANGQGFGDVFSTLGFTIRWATTSTATLGTRTNTCPSGIPISQQTIVVNPSVLGVPTGFNYRTYLGTGTSLLDDEGCPLPQDTWFTVMTVPVTGNTGCTTFSIVNDAYTTEQNKNYFISLGGVEKTGVIDPNGIQIGTCTTDCNGVVGGPAVAGSPCNDNNACTINDVYAGTFPNCTCAGTPDNTDTDGDGVPNCSDNCPTISGQQGSACIDGDPCTDNDVLNASCVCTGTPNTTDTDGDGVPNCSDNCPNVTGQQGSACNDNNACTTGDVLNASCVCTGTPDNTDTDGDGVPNCSDNCPNVTGQQGSTCNDGNACTTGDVLNASCVCVGAPDNTDTDGDGTPNCSDNCPNVAGQQGSTCDDGNACTVNDVLNASCVCAGTTGPDSDGDGILDCNDNCPNLSGVQGDACDDGNANTTGDIITANCVCAGTLANDCEGVPGGPAQPGTSCNDNDVCTTNDVYSASCVCAGTFQDSDNDGTCDANDPCDNNTDGDACDDGDACTVNDVLDNCVCAGAPGPDSDGDGILDCNDNCPNLSGEQGDACDDNNPNTTGDVITANCLCAGTLANDCEGVPGGPAQPGTSCDDSDACTVNDVYDANCACAGTFQDGDGDGTCDADDGCPTDPDKIAAGTCGCGVPDTDTDGDGTADCVDACPFLANVTPGDACDDGNALTFPDTYNATCVCTGPTVACVVAGDCNDNDDCTTDDCVANACVYTPVADTDGDGTCDAIDGCVNDPDKIAPGVCGCGNDEPGTACDDLNVNTENDQINANCVCEGQLIGVDCEGTPGGSELPGTDCDDNNAATGNDTWSASCVCEGLLIDCLGVPGGTATVGSACNDADACTINDVYSASCVCAGTFQDTDGDGVCNANDNCPNVAGQQGSTCDDGNSNTINDVLNANCLCVGQPIGGCTENLTLSITLDANGAQTSWTLYDATETGVLDAGGPYSNGTPGAVVTEPICVPAGCYHLRFSDSGNDGITGGGYVLRDASNKRIIDASVGSFTTTSEIGGTGARNFCVPLGGLNILNNWCDRSNLLITSPVYCNSQPGVTGYQWWIYNPHGTYNRRVTTTTNIVVPVNLNTNPVPANTWLNIRVRPVFTGGPGEFGPACRVRFIPNQAGPGREVLFDEGTSVTMSLYPNPTRDGLVTLNMQGVDVADEVMVDIDVYDMLGKRVFTERAVAAEGVVNHRMELGAEIGTGLYMVNVTVEGKLYTQRLVIQ